MLARIAREYDRDYGHFTTRQNIQYNWPKLETGAGHPGAARDGADARDPDQRQLHPQRHGRSPRRRRARRARGSAAVVRIHPPVGDAASRVLVPAAQVQDRGDRLAAGSRRLARARHRPAPGAQRGRRSRLRGAGRRRPRPHADDRPRDPRVPAEAGPARVPRSDPARLQPRRPARQHPQGAHQDPGEGASARRNSASWSKPSSRPRATRRRCTTPPRSSASRRSSRRRTTRRCPTRTSRPASRASSATGIAQNTRKHKVPGYRAVFVSLKSPSRPPGDITADADGPRRRPRRPLFARAGARHARPEPAVRGRAPARPVRAVAGAEGDRPGDAEHRHADRHDLLPGPGFLLAGQRALDSDRRSRSTSASTISTTCTTSARSS